VRRIRSELHKSIISGEMKPDAAFINAKLVQHTLTRRRKP